MRSIQEDGFSIFSNVFSCDEVESLLPDDANGRPGMRHALKDPNVLNVAQDSRLIEIACSVLGSTAFPFRATFFSKTARTNWLVTWHQDRALPIRERREAAGWGPWTFKAGVAYAFAPASALERILALRVHLDDCRAASGPLRVLPETHKLGVLTDDAVHAMVRQFSPVDCLVPRGGVLAMRPLLLHASSKSQGQVPRRVLHIEYAATTSLADGLELAVV